MRVLLMTAMIIMLVAGLHAAGAFVDNGNGTVTNTKTGLVWQKCSAGQNALDCSGKGTTYNWEKAIEYCANLTETLAGKKWRLPKVEEIETIVDKSKTKPAVNTTIFPNTESLFYWSSSTIVDYTSDAWGIFFDIGEVSSSNKTVANLVRCVADAQ